MQKKLIALAVVAAFSAPAFADVSMYGVADAALVNVSGSGLKGDTQVVSGGLAQSRIGAKAAEDLNNGMKAVVVLEYGLDTQISSGLSAATARQQMLAVAGDFGTFATGYLQTTGYDFGVKFDPTAGSSVSPLQSMTRFALIGSGAVGARAPRALAYISPNFNGLSFAVNYSTDVNGKQKVDPVTSALGLGSPYANVSGLGNLGQASGTADAKVSAYLLSASYDWNALSVGAVIADANASAINTHIKDWALGASYDFGAAKVFGTYQTTKLDISNLGLGSSKIMSLSVVAPVGPGAVLASYAKNSLDTKTFAANQDGNGFTVGYLQGLSKTTTAYVTYTKIGNGSAGTAWGVINNAIVPATAGGSTNMLALGLNKKF